MADHYRGSLVLSNHFFGVLTNREDASKEDLVTKLQNLGE